MVFSLIFRRNGVFFVEVVVLKWIVRRITLFFLDFYIEMMVFSLIFRRNGGCVVDFSSQGLKSEKIRPRPRKNIRKSHQFHDTSTKIQSNP